PAYVFTKCRPDTLVLNSAAAIFGSTQSNGLNVQEGTLRIGASGSLLRQTTAVKVNLGATLDLNGQNVPIASLNNAINNSGGIVTNSSATAATLTINGV